MGITGIPGYTLPSESGHVRIDLAAMARAGETFQAAMRAADRSFSWDLYRPRVCQLTCDVLEIVMPDGTLTAITADKSRVVMGYKS